MHFKCSILYIHVHAYFIHVHAYFIHVYSIQYSTVNALQMLYICMYIYNSCILHTMYSTCTCTCIHMLCIYNLCACTTDMLYNVQYKHMYSTCSRVHTHLMLYNIYTCTSDSLYIQCTNYYNV